MAGAKGAKMRIGTAVALAAALAPLVAQALPAADLFYERTLMRAADARCGLFAPQVSAALGAAAVQARGAALRSGATAAALTEVETRARAKAAGTACASPDLVRAAARVRDGFAGWARTARMTFPGERAAWKADRTAYRSPAWKLSQSTRMGLDEATFGLAGRHDAPHALLAVARFSDGARPYAARLVLRDPARSSRPWLPDARTGEAPPRQIARVELAQAKSAASTSLAPAGARDALAFRFPAEAARALTGLDPREQFAVEFVMADDSVRTARFEVGDFAAGRAFLALGAL